MPDEEQVQTAGKPERTSELHVVESQRLIALGFDPTAPIYESNDGCSEEAIAKALFGSDRDKPHTIPFNIQTRDEDCVLPMEVELVQVVYVTSWDVEAGQPDPFPDPAWYLRGYLGRCDINPTGEVVRMHAYTFELRNDLEATVQIVRELPVKIPAISLNGQLVQSFGHPRIADRLSG